MKLSKTGIGLLTRQYRAVLKKCLLINLGLWTLGATLATTTPACADQNSKVDDGTFTWAEMIDFVYGYVDPQYDQLWDELHRLPTYSDLSGYAKTSDLSISSWDDGIKLDSGTYYYGGRDGDWVDAYVRTLDNELHRVEGLIPDTSNFVTTSVSNLTNYYTKSQIDNAGYLTSSALSDYVTFDEIDAAAYKDWTSTVSSNNNNLITSGGVYSYLSTNYYTKSQIDNAGYLTSSALSDYVTFDEIDAAAYKDWTSTVSSNNNNLITSGGVYSYLSTNYYTKLDSEGVQKKVWVKDKFQNIIPSDLQQIIQHIRQNAECADVISVANAASSKSVGSSSNTRKIVNVTAGSADTDAVNYGQIKNFVTASTNALNIFCKKYPPKNTDNAVNTKKVCLRRVRKTAH